MKVQNKDTGEVVELYGTNKRIEEGELVSCMVATDKEGNMVKISASEYKEHYQPYNKESTKEI